MKYLLPLIVCLAFYPLPGFAEPQTDVLLFRSNMNGISMQPYLRVYEDKSGDMTLQEVADEGLLNQFMPLSKNSLGYSRSVFWLYFEIENNQSDAQVVYIENEFSPIDRLELYDSNHSDKPIMFGGDYLPFHIRPVKYRNMVFPIELSANQHRHLFIRIITTSSVNLSFKAFNKEHFYEQVIAEELVLGVYYGILLVMVFYNLFLFFSVREWTYFFYICYLIVYGLFQFTINGLAFQFFWPNSTVWANQAQVFFIFFTSLPVAFFCVSFLDVRRYTPRAYWIYNAIIFASLAGMFLSLLQTDYQIIMQVAVFFTMGVIVFIWFNALATWIKGSHNSKFFLLAWSLFFAGIVVFILKSVGFLPSNWWTQWSIQLGSALEIVLISFALADRINILKNNLQSKYNEINIAKEQLSKSELRYRTLFDASEAFTFILDEKWHLLSANKAVQQLIKFKPTDVLGKNFLELIYLPEGNQNEVHAKIFVLEQLEILNENRKKRGSVQFQTEFKQKFLQEPVTMSVHLQYLQINERWEILGTATHLPEDSMLSFLVREQLSLQINNHLQNAELVSHKLTMSLKRYVDSGSLFAVRTCLREIIINAIEHGNLAISFEEKTQQMLKGDYLHFVKERQQNANFSSRVVNIDYILLGDRVEYVIEDQGAGFDHRKASQVDLDELNEEMISHGRGIRMTLETFDVVEYNDKGNKVLLIKKFN